MQVSSSVTDGYGSPVEICSRACRVSFSDNFMGVVPVPVGIAFRAGLSMQRSMRSLEELSRSDVLAPLSKSSGINNI